MGRKDPIQHNGVPVDKIEYATDAFAEQAVKFIEASKDKPWLAVQGIWNSGLVEPNGCLVSVAAISSNVLGTETERPHLAGS